MTNYEWIKRRVCTINYDKNLLLVRIIKYGNALLSSPLSVDYHTDTYLEKDRDGLWAYLPILKIPYSSSFTDYWLYIRKNFYSVALRSNYGENFLKKLK